MAEGAVRRHTGNHHLGAHIADVLHPGVAPPAAAADRDERRHDVVAGRELRHAVADFEHDARAFVAADHREHRRQAVRLHHLVGRGHVAVADVLVGVTQPGGGHLDEHLAGLRRVEFEFLDRPLLTHVVQDRRAGPHATGRKVTGRCLGERNGIPTIFVSSSAISSEIGHPVEEAVQHRLRFDPGQMHAEAAVDAAGERDVRAPRSVDVEHVGILPSLLVAIGRTHAQVDLRALRDRHAVHLDIAGGVARHQDQRGLVPDPLLDRGGNEVAIPLQRLELVRMSQQQLQQVSRRPVGGLESGRQQQPQERDDRLVGEFLAVDLRGDEIADDVVGHRAAPLVHLLLEVGAQFDRRRQAGLDVLGDRDQVQRQPPEQSPDPPAAGPSSAAVTRVGNSNVTALTRSTSPSSLNSSTS